MSNERKIEEMLESLKKEYNEYKRHIQTIAIPKLESWKWDYQDALKELDQAKSINNALLKFIIENGLAAKYYDRFVSDFYPHDVFNFAPEIEVEMEEVSSKKDLYSLIRHQLLKPETLN